MSLWLPFILKGVYFKVHVLTEKNALTNGAIAKLDKQILAFYGMTSLVFLAVFVVLVFVLRLLREGVFFALKNTFIIILRFRCFLVHFFSRNCLLSFLNIFTRIITLHYFF